MWGAPLNEYGRIRRVALRRPAESFVDQARLDAEWRRLNYTTRPDYAGAEAEYLRLIQLMKGEGAEIDFLPADPGLTIDSIYVRDAAIVSPRGIILCNMGKPDRRGEPAVAGAAFHKLGLPIAGVIEGEGRLEGGDLVWFDDRTLAVGHTYRSNDEGIRQLKKLVGSEVEVIVADMPHYRGRPDVFHLMSVLSPIDRDLALVYSPLMPIRFRDWLLGRGIRLVEVPEAEFDSMGCNVLAIAPRRCIMLQGNPLTREALQAAGAEVIEIAGRDISEKGQGGPTCLTRPLLRA
ncbi:MAG: dimethylargininase [Rhodospirillaceae bacterium]|jgi:N-dimethylarginine dimethylaminohydrolase|nr:dimethylargininase [Rhodospirillaceae bacterium]